jgi:hypothetical protein
MFPVIQMRQYHQPRSVPWSLMEGHETQVQINHGQTLQWLAKRGGLDIFELWCVVHDRRWQERASYRDVLLWLKSIEGVVW